MSETMNHAGGPSGDRAAQQIDVGAGTAAATPPLRTLGAVARVFVRRRSPQVLLSGLTISVLVRLVVVDGQRWRWWDLVAVVMVAVLAPLFEWFIHLFVLHLPPTRIGPVLFDPGAGHRQHHLFPSQIDRVLLRGREAALFQLANAAIVALLLGIPLVISGSFAPEPILTGVIAAVAALTHYEWSHFLFHTAYQPKTRFYRRLKRNHRMHHWRNERYWLGITSNAGDRLFRTYPADRSAVPRSPTARTLNGEQPTQTATQREPGRTDQD
ncbi:MAG: sterol desaturase family protein [Actinomycetota bacterium]